MITRVPIGIARICWRYASSGSALTTTFVGWSQPHNLPAAALSTMRTLRPFSFSSYAWMTGLPGGIRRLAF